MGRLRQVIILLAIIGIPAAALPFFQSPAPLCFSSGALTYEVSPAGSAADYRVRVDNRAADPQLRFQLVDRPEIADFVLVDDTTGMQGNGCNSTDKRRTVALVDRGISDLTISLSSESSADYKLYVHSQRVSPQQAAALFALMQGVPNNRLVAAR